MSSIQRFRTHGGHGDPLCISEHQDGEYVLYADHVAAMEDWHHDPGTRCDGCHSFGFEEGVQAARDAVAGMVIETVGNSAATVDQALAAIDALRGDR